MTRVVTNGTDGRCDVLVVGAGIAGTQAALAAAQSGARVALASAGGTFSGSSFFAGTWGLRLIAPDGENDVDDLAWTPSARSGAAWRDLRCTRVLPRNVDPPSPFAQPWPRAPGGRQRRREGLHPLL